MRTETSTLSSSLHGVAVRALCAGIRAQALREELAMILERKDGSVAAQTGGQIVDVTIGEAGALGLLGRELASLSLSDSAAQVAPLPPHTRSHPSFRLQLAFKSAFRGFLVPFLRILSRALFAFF